MLDYGKGKDMRQVAGCVGLLVLIWASGLSAQPMEESLRQFRAAVSGMGEINADSASREEAARRYGAIDEQIRNAIRTDPETKKRVAAEILDQARKRYPEPAVNDGRIHLDPNYTADFVYAKMLADTLFRADRPAFLEMCGDMLADSQAADDYKKTTFRDVLSHRFAIQAVDPNSLASYDKAVLSLGMRFMDAKDGFRFTFGDRSDFTGFVMHLIGYSEGSLKAPPLDRAKGLSIARAFIADKRSIPWLISDREWCMDLVVAVDPSAPEEYIRSLKQYIDDAGHDRWRRAKYAKTLVKIGRLDQKVLDGIEKSTDKATAAPDTSQR